jgi:predicted DsbA family dithiol-disulfide isomerase
MGRLGFERSDMAVITVWSDMFCPWGYVAGLRLRRMRDELGADVSFDFRAWPLDVAFRPQQANRVRAEIVALAQHEPSAFTLYEGDLPTSSLLASEAQKWGYSYGDEVGEYFDLAIRRAMFLHTRNLGVHSELLAVARTEGLDADALADALSLGTYRADVNSDIQEGRALPVEGSPTLVLPDGTVFSNPGFEINRVREIPIIVSDHLSTIADLIQRAAWQD